MILLYMVFLLKSGMTFVLYEPSFVSEWYEAVADNQSLASLTINHNLGEYPVKVDVQVKITEGGQDYIFSGLGSSQNDDDYPYDYGGVIYRYNDRCVQLAYPFNNNGYSVSRGLGFTGYGTLYDGPSILNGPYTNGYVRVRVWLALDMPPVVINMSTYISKNDDDNYKELTHGLGNYPDIVTVQTLFSNGYMSDGIGVVFYGNTSFRWNRIGGVLFGYDDLKVRLWTPSSFANTTDGGNVFTAADGYSLGAVISGMAHILGWQHDGSQQVFYSDQVIYPGVTHDSVLNLPFPINLTNSLVSVQFKIPDGDGPNGGMIFYAAGTTQATPLHKYGGLLYVYNENQIFLWHPMNSPLVFIGERWGKGKWAQETDNITVLIKVYSLRKSECPLPESPGNATYHVTGQSYGDMVTYVCNNDFLHLGGDLVRTCERNQRWSGAPPACVVCSNGTENNTYSTISDDEMNDILSEIRVDKTDTNAYKRTLISAEDKRYSARVIGLSGVFVLVVICSLLFLPDIISIVKHACDYESIRKVD